MVTDETTGTKYTEITYGDNVYLVLLSNITESEHDAIEEEKMYIRTPASVYDSNTSSHLTSFIKKGEEVEIIGYDYLHEDGTVNKYKIKYSHILRISLSENS